MSKELPDRDRLLQLWLHELSRVFRDRLINQARVDLPKSSKSCIRCIPQGSFAAVAATRLCAHCCGCVHMYLLI